MESVRPLPEPSAFSAPFWDGAELRKLMYPHCSQCDRAFFPPHLCCPHCRSTGWSWRESRGVGVVYSYSVVHRAPQEGFETPYVLAVVDLAEGFSLMTNLVGIDVDRVQIDMAVQVQWLTVGARTLPVFTVAGQLEERT